jgi:hypothetical protein
MKPQATVKRPSRNTATTAIDDQPLPHLDFQNLKGTLPEIIRPSDLDTLNLALRYLFDFLREAKRQFEVEEDAGRSAAFYALAAFWMFIVAFERGSSERLERPIVHLQDALVGLNEGRVSPIVKPNRRAGRAPSSHTQATLRGYAVATVKFVMDIGLSRTDAHDQVARVLAKLGTRAERGSGTLTARTVRNWCDEVSRDVGRHHTPALQYDFWLARLNEQQSAAKPKDQAQRHALDELVRWVRTWFPASWKKPPNPPI